MKQELTGQKKKKAGVAFYLFVRLFSSENMPALTREQDLPNKQCAKKVDFPLCEIPLLFCFVARKYSMLLKIILTESYPLLFYHSYLFLANSDKRSQV